MNVCYAQWRPGYTPTPKQKEVKGGLLAFTV